MQYYQQGPLIDIDNSQGIYRVHRSVFTDPAILALEQERIFERCWIYAGHESEIFNSGDFVARMVSNRRIILSRGTDGRIRAFYNTCTHKGALVCRESTGNSKGFRCAYHSWFFDTSGKLVNVPKEESYGPHFDKNDYSLREVARVESCHGFIFISLAKDGETLSEFLAGAVDLLEIVASLGEEGMEIASGNHFYTIKSNWKLLLENSSDAYHLLPIHGRYLGFIEERIGSDAMKRLAASALSQSAVTHVGNGHCVMESTPPVGGRVTAYWDPTFGEEMRARVEARRKWYANRYGEERAKRICDKTRTIQIFPNLMILDNQAVSIRQFFPTETGSMDVSAWALLPKGQRADERALGLSVFPIFFGPGGFATPDDIEILESCWQGFVNKEVEWHVNSRGMLRTEARALSDDEGQMRAFWDRWHQLMSNDRAGPATVIGRPSQAGRSIDDRHALSSRGAI